MSKQSGSHVPSAIALGLCLGLSLGQAQAEGDASAIISQDFSRCISSAHGDEAASPQDQQGGDEDKSRSATLKCLDDETKRLKDSIRSDYEEIIASGDEAAKQSVEEGQKVWSASLLPDCQKEVESESRSMVEAGVSDGGDKEISLKECILNGVVSRSLAVKRSRLAAKPSSPEASVSPEQGTPQ